MQNDIDRSKRKFIGSAGTSGLVLVSGLIAPTIGPAFAEEKKSGEKETEVTPPEDLMREHGVLDRILLIYEAGLRKFANKDDFDPVYIVDSAQIVREFIEDYHEKSEEEDVFPHFKKAGKSVDLVNTLLEQHQAGRRVTDVILQQAANSRRGDDARRRTEEAIRSFITMYRPHAAREDTVLFPKLKDIVSSNEYDAMAEGFEKKEHKLFGEDGFGKMVDRVAGLEKKMGIYDLNQFTPS
jgi:hemerythrin-like domain-containing protein